MKGRRGRPGSDRAPPVGEGRRTPAASCSGDTTGREGNYTSVQLDVLKKTNKNETISKGKSL